MTSGCVSLCLSTSLSLSLSLSSWSLIWMSHTFLLCLSLLPSLSPFSYNQILSVFSANWEFLSDIGYPYLVRTVYACCLHFCSTSIVLFFFFKRTIGCWDKKGKKTGCWMSAVWMGSSCQLSSCDHICMCPCENIWAELRSHIITLIIHAGWNETWS